MSLETIGVQIQEDGSRVVARSFEAVAAAAERAERSVDSLKAQLASVSVNPKSDLATPFNKLRDELSKVGSGVGSLKTQLSVLGESTSLPTVEKDLQKIDTQVDKTITKVKKLQKAYEDLRPKGTPGQLEFDLSHPNTLNKEHPSRSEATLISGKGQTTLSRFEEFAWDQSANAQMGLFGQMPAMVNDAIVSVERLTQADKEALNTLDQLKQKLTANERAGLEQSASPARQMVTDFKNLNTESEKSLSLFKDLTSAGEQLSLSIKDPGPVIRKSTHDFENLSQAETVTREELTRVKTELEGLRSESILTTTGDIRSLEKEAELLEQRLRKITLAKENPDLRPVDPSMVLTRKDTEPNLAGEQLSFAGIAEGPIRNLRGHFAKAKSDTQELIEKFNQLNQTGQMSLSFMSTMPQQMSIAAQKAKEFENESKQLEFTWSKVSDHIAQSQRNAQMSLPGIGKKTEPMQTGFGFMNTLEPMQNPKPVPPEVPASVKKTTDEFKQLAFEMDVVQRKSRETGQMLNMVRSMRLPTRDELGATSPAIFNSAINASRGITAFGQASKGATSNLVGLDNELKQKPKDFNNASYSLAMFTRHIWWLRVALETIAGALFLRELKQWSDAWLSATNMVRLSTESTSEAAAVQQRLYDIAIKTRQPFEDIVTLYRRGAMAATTLEASQQELVKMTEAVGYSLLAQGTSIEAARGSLLQLGQMLGMGKVRMQEFNSISENTPRLLLAIVRNIDANVVPTIGGLRRKLEEQNRRGALNWKQLIQGAEEQQIDSKTLFRAIIKGLEDLKKEAGGVQPTFEQSFIGLHNALIKYIGEMNIAYGVSTKFAGGIDWITQNLDTMGKVLASIAISGAVTSLPLIGSGLKTIVGIGSSGGLLGFFSAHPVTALIAGLTLIVSLLWQFSDRLTWGVKAGYTWRDYFVGIFDVVGSKMKWLTDTAKYMWKVLTGEDSKEVKIPLKYDTVQTAQPFTGKAWGYAGTDNVNDKIKTLPFFDDLNKAAKQFDIDVNLLAALVKQESNNNPNAKSNKGAIGLTQLMPGTAKDLGVDPKDIAQNLQGGAHYLRILLDSFNGEAAKALAAYNAGPNTKGGLLKSSEEFKDIYDRLPKETKLYVNRVLGFLDQYQKSSTDLEEQTSKLAGTSRRSPILASMGPNFGSSHTSTTPLYTGHKTGNELVGIPTNWQRIKEDLADLGTGLVSFASAVIATFKIIFNYPQEVFRYLPAALWDLLKEGFNKIIDVVELFINGFIHQINRLLDSTAGKILFRGAGKIEDVNLARWRVGDGVKQLGEAHERVTSAATAKDWVRDFLGSLFPKKEIADAVEKARQERLAASSNSGSGVISDKHASLGWMEDTAKTKEIQQGLDAIMARMSPVIAATEQYTQSIKILDLAREHDIALVDQDGRITKTKMISDSQYSSLLAQLAEHYRDLLDPMGAKTRQLEKELDAYRKSGLEREKALRLLKTEQDLRRSLGRDPTPEETDRLKNLEDELVFRKSIADEAERLYNTLGKAVPKYGINTRPDSTVPNIGGDGTVSNKMHITPPKPTSMPTITGSNYVNMEEILNQTKKLAQDKLLQQKFGEAPPGGYTPEQIDSINGQLAILVDRLEAVKRASRMAMGDGTFLDGLTSAFDQFIEKSKNAAAQFGQAFAAPVQQWVDGLSDAFARGIVYANNLKEMIGNLAREILTTLLSSIFKLIMQWSIAELVRSTSSKKAIADKNIETASIVGKTAALQAETAAVTTAGAATVASGTTATATAVTQAEAAGPAIASAYAPAATATSVATMGTAAAVGLGALIMALGMAAGYFAGKGFESGGFTGNFATDEVAGVVHGQEFVVNAAATARNLPLLERINQGYTFPQYTGSSRSGGAMAVNINVENYAPGVEISAEQVSVDEIRIIARSEARQAVREEAPTVIAADLHNPNGRTSKALRATTKVERNM